MFEPSELTTDLIGRPLRHKIRDYTATNGRLRWSFPPDIRSGLSLKLLDTRIHISRGPPQSGQSWPIGIHVTWPLQKHSISEVGSQPKVTGTSILLITRSTPLILLTTLPAVFLNPWLAVPVNLMAPASIVMRISMLLQRGISEIACCTSRTI